MKPGYTGPQTEAEFVAEVEACPWPCSACRPSPENSMLVRVPHAPPTKPACATCERQNCDADVTGKCPITGEEADDGHNTIGEGDHLL